MASSNFINHSAFLLGCAVWSYKGWVGDFYPPGSKAANFLNLYSRRFTAVEGNTTFYAVPNPETVARWALDTPPGFEFCLKLPRDLTHNGPLQPSISGALSFVDRMKGLGQHLGPTFAQLPPHYGPNRLEDLKAFLEGWSQAQTPLALEVRHRDWFREPHASHLTALLDSLNIGRVLLDSRPIYIGGDDPQLQSERRKPKLPVVFSVTAPFTLVRFISHPDRSVNESFMAEWVQQIREWLPQGIRVYFFVHCPLEERSPHNARHFQQLLEQTEVPVPPLPWNDLESPPQQLSLW